LLLRSPSYQFQEAVLQSSKSTVKTTQFFLRHQNLNGPIEDK
jgi:hypothetical protein